MISENVKAILDKLPDHVTLAAAAKTRSVDEILEAIDAGVTVIGQNYVQEAVAVADAIKGKASLHFIGHLQRNKVKKTVEVCDLIETVDSLKLAEEINRRSAAVEKTMSILIEINSGREPQKFGIFPEALEELVKDIAKLEHVRIKGLMTMGPYTDDSETVRPYFKETATCFQTLKDNPISGVDMEILSMGMSGSYKTAIEEGANLIRIGTRLFGLR
ncbi:YggS family pyridoxal phosphate-dependent enzyme [candidate division KSB1 bacterium]|nr:YggS family pyridoxal phosphate-dependent enzyme [candidate division KSB1 bacterium]